ncbi:hypothetical protein ACFOD0_10085 [Shewanella intestini]|uniref:Uncharacterized protein n=1 Tax=Shewanella intestini TaxID=2017544 RepID=A0ABS5I456_9GAMM|nr:MULTISPECIES: hypothetical protein [Shewanella]MBR9728813.1 hypothetical protein [Shewanella intestini]MRG36889.1 hypothetical protein [Shewanella sp. XMDDZSB0408]
MATVPFELDTIIEYIEGESDALKQHVTNEQYLWDNGSFTRLSAALLHDVNPP